MSNIILTTCRSEKASITITEKSTSRQLTVNELALLLYREGAMIVYCDVNEIIHHPDLGWYYLEDDCNNRAWIDPERFEIDVKK